jgi:hypothetical protein
MIGIVEQHKRIATLQSRWGRDARADYRYNLERARQEKAAGNMILFRAYMKEACWDRQFANKRRAIEVRNRALGGY